MNLKLIRKPNNRIVVYGFGGGFVANEETLIAYMRYYSNLYFYTL